MRLFPLAGWLAAALIAVSGTASATTERSIRVGYLEYGSVAWELDVIERHGLDAANGVAVAPVPLASPSALVVALQGGRVDVIVGDWIWVSRQRAEGRTYTAVPYSHAVGALMVEPDSGIRSLTDLEGRKLGVAGGPLDKSWLLLRALGAARLGRDFETIATPTFAAPPLLNAMARRGRIPAVLTYWHFAARLESAGMQPLISVNAIKSALGATTPVPMLVWIFDERWADANRQAAMGFLDASFAAKRVLAGDAAEWHAVARLVADADPALLQILRRRYAEGVPGSLSAEGVAAAGRLFDILAERGGTDLVGRADGLTSGTFWDGYTIPAAGGRAGVAHR